jgi:hypothetical protein
VSPERLAEMFHETYERLAPEHGYETREASAKPWEQVPEQNRGLMVAVAAEVLNSDRLAAHFEQRKANEQVRRLRRDGICPTCGAEA